jgi:hypothetical protein
VQDYDEATGFKLEVDQSKLKQAYDKLTKAQDNLVIEKLGLGDTNGEIISKIKEMVSSLESVGVKNFLPELKQAYAELSKVSKNTTVNNYNYSYSLGDISTSNSKEVGKMIEKLVDLVVNETQIR